MLRLTVGLARNVVEPNCASHEVSVGLELDTELINQPDRLQEHAHRLFNLARQALGQELTLHGSPGRRPTGPGDGLHNNRRCSRRGRRANRAQILAIHSLATRQEIDLDGLLRDRYRVCQLYELSVSEAGELIGQLQATKTAKRSNGSAAAD